MYSMSKYPFNEHNSYNFSSDLFKMNFVQYCPSEGVCLVKGYVCKNVFFDELSASVSRVFSSENIESIFDLFKESLMEVFSDDELPHITSPLNRREFLDIMCGDFIDEYIIKRMVNNLEMFSFEVNPFDDPTIPPKLIVVLGSEKKSFFNNCDKRAVFIIP